MKFPTIRMKAGPATQQLHASCGAFHLTVFPPDLRQGHGEPQFPLPTYRGGTQSFTKSNYQSS